MNVKSINAVKTAASKIVSAIPKNFFDANNNLVEGVKLINGKAYKVDGSRFTGVMNTFNGKGQKVSLEYIDGFIKKSSIDGQVQKTYEQFCPMSREQMVLIKNLKLEKGVIEDLMLVQHSTNGKALEMMTSKTYDDGRIYSGGIEIYYDAWNRNKPTRIYRVGNEYYKPNN